MKVIKLILMLATTGILFSCNTDKLKSNENSNQQSETPASNQMSVNELQNLAPITLLHQSIKDPFKRYGINIVSNCYACNDTEFTVKDNKAVFTNVCDDKAIFAFEITKITEKAQSIELEFDGKKAVFEKLEDTPIYELKIEGEALKLKESVTSKYYTPKELLPKFEQHNCGDFEG